MSNDHTTQRLENDLQKLKEEERQLNAEIRQVEQNYQSAVKRLGIDRDNHVRQLEDKRHHTEREIGNMTREIERHRND